MLSKVTNLVLAYPRTTLCVVLMLTLIMGFGMKFIKTDTDVTRVLPDHIPAKALYDRIGDLFPSKETIVIGIEGEQLFSVDGIARLNRLTHQLESLSAIDSVLSPTNATVIDVIPDGLSIRAAAEPLPTTVAEAAAFRTKLFDQPMFLDTLIAEDGQAVALLVFLKPNVREADAAKMVMELAADAGRNQGFELNVTGRAASAYWSRIIMSQDMGVLTSAALAVIVILLFVVFRSFRGVLLPLTVVTTSLIWTFGLMGYAGIYFTHTIEVLPILLMAIGVADGMHILKGYGRRVGKGGERQTIVRATMLDLNRPIVMTSITTMAAFLALNTSGIISIMVLGALTAFGILIAMLVSLILLPALLMLLPLPKQVQSSLPSIRKTASFDRITVGYASFLLRYRAWVAAVALLIIAAAIFGSSRVAVEFSTLSNYQSDHPFRMAADVVNRHFGSTTSLVIVIEGKENDAIKSPAVLHKMDQLETWLQQQEHVGAIQSITGYIKQMHQVLHGGGVENYRLPRAMETETYVEFVQQAGVVTEQSMTRSVSGQELVAQYLTLYEMGSAPGDFANLITYDYATARINVFIDSDRASDVAELHHKVNAYIDANFGELEAQLTGMTALIRAVNDMVVKGQALSIVTSLIIVFFIASWMFRSLVIGFFCILPLFFSLFLNFGFMGLSGIPLNVETIATSSVAIGAGIDYAIHFTHRYQTELRSALDYSKAVVQTLRTSGAAIFFNALTVAAGFFTLTLSNFQGVANLGLLIALTMITSAFAALTLLPLIITYFKPKAFMHARI